MESQNSRYGVIVLGLTTVTGSLTICFPLTCLNPAVPVLKRMYNKTYFDRSGEPMPDGTWTALLSITMSMLFIGGFVGALLLKFLLSRMTRKQVMIVIHITSILGYAVIALGGGIWGSYEAFITGRFVTGFAIGLGLGLFPLVVSELSVPHARPLYSGVLATLYMFGILWGAVIGWPKVFGSDDRWLGITFFGMIPSFIYLACAYWISDTPMQAMLKGGPAKALEVLRKLRSGRESAFEAEVQGLGGGNEGGSAEATLKEVFQTPQYRRHFIGMVILFSYITACGLSNVLFFSDTIFANAGLGQETTTPATIGVFAIGTVATFVGIFVMKCVDSRTLILIGSVAMILGDAFLTASNATFERVPIMSAFSVVAMCIYYFGFSVITQTAYVIMAVISIDRTRSAGMYIGSMGFWFCGWFVGFISPYLQIGIGPYAFLVWMVVTIAITIYIVFFVPNVLGKTEEEIQDFYKGRDEKENRVSLSSLQ